MSYGLTTGDFGTYLDPVLRPDVGVILVNGFFSLNEIFIFLSFKRNICFVLNSPSHDDMPIQYWMLGEYGKLIHDFQQCLDQIFSIGIA